MYDYDANGNMTHITQTTGDSETVEKLRTNLWDEENRLRAVDITPDAEGVRPVAIYTYDAGGERILKHSNTSVSIYLNGKKVADTIQTDAILYPSGMLVAKLGNNGNEEQTLAYTKHYYAGTQRVSSKIGTTENLGDFLQDWFTQGTGGPVDVIGSSFGVLENAEEGVIQVYEALEIEPPTYESDPVFIPIQSFTHAGSEREIYWFHPDHLGSTSYITNVLGEVSQHMEYFAFGETFVEEHRSSNNSPYKFNGKELDEETGWYYYGARYYDPKISLFLSYDPMGESTMTPYQYTYQNPINLTDPTGMVAQDGDGDFYNEKGEKVGTDNIDDGRIYITQGNENNFLTAPKYEIEGGLLTLGIVEGSLIDGENKTTDPRVLSPDNKGGMHENVYFINTETNAIYSAIGSKAKIENGFYQGDVTPLDMLLQGITSDKIEGSNIMGHLHPLETITDADGKYYSISARQPTANDKIAFKKYSTNFITGNIETGGVSEANGKITTYNGKQGVVFYDNLAREQQVLTRKAVQNIIKDKTK